MHWKRVVCRLYMRPDAVGPKWTETDKQTFLFFFLKNISIETGSKLDVSPISGTFWLNSSSQQVYASRSSHASKVTHIQSFGTTKPISICKSSSFQEVFGKCQYLYYKKESFSGWLFLSHLIRLKSTKVSICIDAKKPKNLNEKLKNASAKKIALSLIGLDIHKCECFGKQKSKRLPISKRRSSRLCECPATSIKVINGSKHAHNTRFNVRDYGGKRKKITWIKKIT